MKINQFYKVVHFSQALKLCPNVHTLSAARPPPPCKALFLMSRGGKIAENLQFMPFSLVHKAHEMGTSLQVTYLG